MDFKFSLYSKISKEISVCIFVTMCFIINNKYNFINTKLRFNNYELAKLISRIIHIFRYLLDTSVQWILKFICTIRERKKSSKYIFVTTCLKINNKYNLVNIKLPFNDYKIAKLI